MLNPWLDLPASTPFVAPQAVTVLRRESRALRGRFEFKLDLLPQPWTGSVHEATVFLLALTFQTRTPFYFLDPAFVRMGGYAWWHRRLLELIEVTGLEAVARRVMCVERFPYKSVSYRPLRTTLPSQEYFFELVRQAILQGKQIVVMRSERVWLQSVPALRE